MQIENDGLLNNFVRRLDRYREWAAIAHQQTGKSWTTQLREILALSRTGGRCTVSNYYWYALYNEDYLEGRGAQDFLGWPLREKFSLSLNPRYAVLPAWDKTVFMLMARAANLPVAPVVACYHPAQSISEALGLHLKTKDAVAKFLRDPSVYPLFAKPAFSQQGYGSAYLSGYDAISDRLQMLDGTSVALTEFLRRLDEAVDERYHRARCGYLFQEPLALAPEIQKLTQWSALCAVRIVCLNGPEGVKPIRAIWRVSVPPNHVDNFSMGKYGNLLANVDLATGEIGKMLGGFWPKTEVLHKHPFTGESFDGFRLPQWDRLLKICQDAGAVFPLMKIHHWDIALTTTGPVILELNDVGGTESIQLHGHGLLTEETREFLKMHANLQVHPWIKAL